MLNINEININVINVCEPVFDGESLVRLIFKAINEMPMILNDFE